MMWLYAIVNAITADHQYSDAITCELIVGGSCDETKTVHDGQTKRDETTIADGSQSFLLLSYRELLFFREPQRFVERIDRFFSDT